MAQHLSTIELEEVPLDEARRMSRGPRMAPHLYQQLRTRLQSLSEHAGCMTVPDGTSPTTRMNRLLRVAAEFGIFVTIGRVPGGLRFWRSTDDDVQQGAEVASRLQSAQRNRQARRGRRRQG